MCRGPAPVRWPVLSSCLRLVKGEVRLVAVCTGGAAVAFWKVGGRTVCSAGQKALAFCSSVALIRDPRYRLG